MRTGPCGLDPSDATGIVSPSCIRGSVNLPPASEGANPPPTSGGWPHGAQKKGFNADGVVSRRTAPTKPAKVCR
eukprot:CAMPEP_0181170548 /NCGR_PEP_ID=MMETSP1096-20121128/1423_1 /TAXON_ID=156174 ORGANISM="Chrysochromulina ericina, Strain CCMP281" /NCGR_SAMPLE_ID=MMETSP1096 /ASSEMBLY_ACC=CAM_ASM_000453 /LENGTH=73 /DNA_ID=CAMNT_0023258113 /DNA_START=546 /DNA_END=767 /DNA_ORIENTATION=-